MSSIKRSPVGLGVLTLALLAIAVAAFFAPAPIQPLRTLVSTLGESSADEDEQARIELRSAQLRWFQHMRLSKARLIDPEEILLGAYDDTFPERTKGIHEFEASLSTYMPLIHHFIAWGDGAAHTFPRALAVKIWEMGSVPLITWEPWLSTFAEGHRGIPPKDQRDKGGLAAIARGDYDFYLDDWFADAAEFGHPIFVRFGHGMNDPHRYDWGPQNNHPEDYRAAFRHAVQAARSAGATNIIWVWSPHIVHEGFEDYYPGDDVVDWVGATVLNYGEIAAWSAWWSFDDIFTRKYDRLATYNKPIMIAELGTLSVGGERASWYAQALARLPQRLPGLRALVFFHARSDSTATDHPLDWTFDKERRTVAAIKAAMETWNRSHNNSDGASSLSG